MGKNEQFDRTYFQRFYLNPRTAVTTRAEMNTRGNLISSFVNHMGQPVKRILDAGCGIGLLRAPLKRAWPKAEYVGFDTSEYLAAKYGWICSTLQDFRSRKQFDVVICCDVMQYLKPAEARRSIQSLTECCRGVLYFGALTKEDWEQNCDQSRTDGEVLLRPAEWYRRELSKGFHQIGAGFWLRRGTALYVWELDTPGEKRKSR